MDNYKDSILIETEKHRQTISTQTKHKQSTGRQYQHDNSVKKLKGQRTKNPWEQASD